MSLSPRDLQHQIAFDLVRIREQRRHMDTLQDEIDEARYPAIDYTDARWSNPTRYATNDDVQDLEDAMSRDWPGQS